MKNRKIKAWIVTYENYFVGTYKSKKQAEIAIEPNPEGYEIYPCEIIFNLKKK